MVEPHISKIARCRAPQGIYFRFHLDCRADVGHPPGISNLPGTLIRQKIAAQAKLGRGALRVLLLLQGFHKLRQIVDAKIDQAFVLGTEQRPPHRHIGGAMGMAPGAEFQHGCKVIRRELSVVVLC